MALGKEFFLKKIQTLPSAGQRALGKKIKKNTNFLRGHSAKNFFLKKIQTLPSAGQRALGKEFKKKSNFAERRPEGTRQRILRKKIKHLYRGPDRGHSVKNFLKKNKKIFTKCLQGWYSAKRPSTGPAPWRSLLFAECLQGSRQSLCRVPDKRHSTKRALPINFLPCVLCRVPHSAKALPSAIWPLPSASGTRQRTWIQLWPESMRFEIEGANVSTTWIRRQQRLLRIKNNASGAQLDFVSPNILTGSLEDQHAEQVHDLSADPFHRFQ